MSKFLADFLSDESGATAIEYGLIAAGIAIVIIGAVSLVGASLIATFTQLGPRSTRRGPTKARREC